MNVEMHDGWRVSEEEPGYMIKTIKHGKATIDILRPILTEAESVVRGKRVINSLMGLAPYCERKRGAAQTAH